MPITSATNSIHVYIQYYVKYVYTPSIIETSTYTVMQALRAQYSVHITPTLKAIKL